MSKIPMELFQVEVTAAKKLSRDFVRISLASEQLSRLAAPAGDGNEQVLDSYINLFIPHPDRTDPVVPDLHDAWRKEWFAASPEERGGWIRTYTLRDSRPWTSAEGKNGVEIDVDFVLHPPEGTDEEGQSPAMGPGASWASSARVGDGLSFIGPPRDGQLWAMWKPEQADTVIVCADETAVPAAMSVLRTLPTGCKARFLLEVPEGNGDLVEHAEPLLARARENSDVELHWLERGEDGVRGALTLQALREILELEPKEEDADSPLGVRLPAEEFVWQTADHPGSTYVYLAGEASVVRAARRVCANEAGIPKSSISFMGYWKAGHAES